MEREYYQVLSVVWALTIFFVSSLPPGPGSGGDGLFLKEGVHFIEFLIFSIFLFKGLESESNLFYMKFFFIAISFAFLTEVYQLIFPYRAFQLWDFAVNSFGIVFGVFAVKVVK